MCRKKTTTLVSYVFSDKALVAMAIENEALGKFVKEGSVSQEVLQSELELLCLIWEPR